MKTYVTDSTLQEANSSLYMSMLERLGVHLPCSHVINQIWRFAGSSYRDELSERVRLFGRYREFDKAIKSRYEGLANYEQEIINEENVLCKTHFNIMLLEDEDAVLDRCIEQVKMIFTNAGFKYYIPSYESLYNILSVRFLDVKTVWMMTSCSSLIALLTLYGDKLYYFQK